MFGNVDYSSILNSRTWAQAQTEYAQVIVAKDGLSKLNVQLEILIVYRIQKEKKEKVALKRKSLYYSQVQGQMMVTDNKETYFLFFNDESYTIESINMEEEFWLLN